MTTTHRRAVGWWLAIWTAMLLGTVMIGGITRLTDSGLSITEWKPVTGVVPPIGQEAWEEAFARYRQIPEFRVEHPTMDLGAFKRIYLWEYFHRLWARLVGLALLLPLIWFWRRGALDSALQRRGIVLLVLVGLQAAMGWIMVQSGLTVGTDVSHYRLAAHLGLALLIIAFTVAPAVRLLVPVKAGEPLLSIRLVTGWVVLVSITAIAGALVAGLDAGRIFNEFPRMGGRWFPLGYWRLTPWWTNLLENQIAVQFNHRVLATVTAIAGLWVGVRAARDPCRPVRHAGMAITLIVTLQYLLGILTLLYGVPVAVAVAHQATAVVLFGTSVALAAMVGSAVRRVPAPSVGTAPLDGAVRRSAAR